MTRQRHDDDDAFDERGILKDGRSYRVPLRMMDAMQRDVARHGARITDAMGESGPALRRPGYRVSDAFPRDWSVYDAYDEEVSRMWENKPSTSNGSSGPRSAQPGDSCTLNGRAGRLRSIGGSLVCVPDNGQFRGNDSVMSDRELAHLEYQTRVENSWRGNGQ
jgi:hypothetical protein